MITLHRRTRRRLPLLPALLLVAACGGRESAAPAEAPSTLEVELSAVEIVELPEVSEILGSVEAERTAALSARVMAMVTAVHVQAGDLVDRGQLLLEIDPQAAQGQLSQARGALAQAEAALALAARNHQRFAALAAADAAAELEVDLARMQHEQARAAVQQAEGSVAAAAAVAGDSRVVAPFAGRVVRTMVEVGDLAAPGRPLVVLESSGARRLSLAVPEGVAARAGLAIGDSVTVGIDSRPDLGRLSASVVERAPAADPASHAFTIEVQLPVDDVASGAAGRAWLEHGSRKRVVVRESAILRLGGLTQVVVRRPDGRAGARVVTLGESLGDGRVEVLSGLAGGETVALGLSSVPAPEARLAGPAGIGS